MVGLVLTGHGGTGPGGSGHASLGTHRHATLGTPVPHRAVLHRRLHGYTDMVWEQKSAMGSRMDVRNSQKALEVIMSWTIWPLAAF